MNRIKNNKIFNIINMTMKISSAKVIKNNQIKTFNNKIILRKQMDCKMKKRMKIKKKRNHRVGRIKNRVLLQKKKKMR